MSRLTKVAIGLGGALLSLWVGAVVITMLPEGTFALHSAAFLSIVLGCAVGIAYAVRAWDNG